MDDELRCANCNDSLERAEGVLLKGSNPHRLWCHECAAAAQTRFERETSAPNLKRALVWGTLAGLACAVVWFSVVVITGWEATLLAVAVGYLVAKTVMSAAGNKRGRRIQWLSVAITLAAMMLAHYLIVQHLLVGYLRRQGEPDVPMFLPFVPMLVMSVVALFGNIVTVGFWAIALLEAYVLPTAVRPPFVNPPAASADQPASTALQ